MAYPVKPSRYQQWQERSYDAQDRRGMTEDEIVNFRLRLAESYKCRPENITYRFTRITNEDDPDKDTCVLLIYSFNCVVSGVPTKRQIFSIKIPVPEFIRRAADAELAANAKSSRPARAVKAPAQTPSAQTPPVQTPPAPSADPTAIERKPRKKPTAKAN